MNFSPLMVSLKISCVSIIFTFVFGILTAYKMHFYKGKLKFFINGLINVSLVLPPTITGFILLVILGRHGLIGSPLHSAGLHIIFTWQAGVIASFFVTFPLMYHSVLSSIAIVDPAIFEAAHSEGASKWQALRYIAVPMVMPGILSGTILAFMRSVGEFGATLMVAGNIPGKTQTISTAIYFFAVSGNYHAAVIWVVFLVLFSLLFLLLVNALGAKS